MNKMIKRNVLVSAILAIMLCVSLIAGATFALFTSESKVNIAVSSGKVSVIATIDESTVQTKELNTNYEDGKNNMYEGVATFNEDGLTLEKFVPGDGIKFNIVVKNESNVTVQYRTIISCANDGGLFAGLNVTIGNEVYNGETAIANWAELAVDDQDATVPVSIELPEDAGNEYQEKSCVITYKVEAVQGNAPVINTTATGTTKTESAIEDANGNTAVAPAGVKVEGNVLTLEVKELEETEENVQTGYFELADDSQAYAFNVNVPQIADDNDVAIVITMAAPANLANVVLFHKGVAMTAVASAADVDEHHEFFYDEAGEITFATKNFSNFTLVSNVEGVAFVNNAEELIDALANADVKEVILNCDIKVEPAKLSNAYGTTGIKMENNQTLNGNGYTLTIKGASGTWDSGINTTGGTIKNITVTGSFRGIFINHNSSVKETVYLENVIITGTTYTISCDQADNKGLVATNCEFYGWTSFAKTLGKATFNNCVFAKGAYNFSRPYAETLYINCTFGEGHAIDPRASISLVKCNLNGVEITAENLSDLVTGNIANAQVGGYYYEDAEGNAVVYDDVALDKALKAGYTSFVLLEGEYVIPNSAAAKTLKLVGEGNVNVIIPDAVNNHPNSAMDSSTVTFENITFKASNLTYTGYTRLTATFVNCTFYGVYTLYGNSEFTNCEFNVSGDQYNIWTWGAPVATFNGCTFNSDGKAVLLYGQANTKLTLNNCVFNDTGVLADLKAAVEIGNDYNSSYELIVNNTIVNGYEINDKGINTGSTLWGNKNSMGTDKLNVVIDGVDVY